VRQPIRSAFEPSSRGRGRGRSRSWSRRDHIRSGGCAGCLWCARLATGAADHGQPARSFQRTSWRAIRSPPQISGVARVRSRPRLRTTRAMRTRPASIAMARPGVQASIERAGRQAMGAGWTEPRWSNRDEERLPLPLAFSGGGPRPRAMRSLRSFPLDCGRA